jgi:drug/metabolite transporter (DMT)-like permease
VAGLARLRGGTLEPVDRVRLFGIALVVIAAIGYGSGGLFARPAYAAGVDWLTVGCWRFGIAFALSWVVVALRPSTLTALRAMSRRTVLVSLALGAMLILQSGTYYAALETVPVSLAGLITAIYPPVVAVLALRFGRPLDGRRAWFALALTVVGMVFAVGGIATDVMPPVTGLLLAISAPCFYAFWIVLAARHSGETRERTGTQAGTAADGTDALATGALLLTGSALIYWALALGTGHPVLPADIPTAAWPGMLGVALVAGFLAPQAFYAGNKRVGAAQAALISTVEPLWTILAAGVVLGEVLSATQWMGAVLILTGVVLSQTRGRGAHAQVPDVDDEPVLPQPPARVADD